MISDEEIRNLPDDPRLAFATYVQKLREVVKRDANSNDDVVEREYVANVRAFAEICGIDVGVTVSPETFWPDYAAFNDSLDYLVAKFRLESLRGNGSPNFSQVELGESYRVQIHGYLSKVRKIVLAVQLEERLRENILKRLNQLASEVDKGRSGFARFLDTFIEVTAAVEEGAENLEPAVKLLERVSGLFGKARKENDVKKISGRDETKLIMGPDPHGRDDEEV